MPDIRISSFLMAKILVTIDDKLLPRVDEAARNAGLSRSAYLSRLASRELGAERGPGADPKVGQAIERLQQLFRRMPPLEDSTAAIRAERVEDVPGRPRDDQSALCGAGGLRRGRRRPHPL